MRKVVAHGIIGRAVWFFVAHEVNNEHGGRDEKYLHCCVVEGDEVHEQIQVPHQEHDEVYFLRLTGKAFEQSG